MNNINIIVAVSQNNIIGINGHLPWNISTDKKYFLDKIKDGIIIEGSKSYLKRKGPLSNTYKTIVLSKDITKKINNAYKCNNLYDAILLAKNIANNQRQIWICGGENIYKESMIYADKLYITNIYKKYDGDTFFVENWKNYFKDNKYTSLLYTENNVEFNFQIYTK